MKTKYTETAEIFKSFCDENRIRILEMLKSGEKCACNLLDELNVTQPTLSHHMKILCDASIVDSRKDGKWTYYKISSDGKSNAMLLLDEILTPNSETKDTCCN